MKKYLIASIHERLVINETSLKNSKVKPSRFGIFSKSIQKKALLIYIYEISPIRASHSKGLREQATRLFPI